MNENVIVAPQTITLIGRIKNIILTDLSESKYDVAIVNLSNVDITQESHKVVSSPVFLARQLGMSNGRPEHLQEDNRPTDPKEAEAFDEQIKQFLNDRATSARKWLMNKSKTIRGDYYRIRAEHRIAGTTGYGEEVGNLTPHTRSGYHLIELEQLDEFEMADVELTKALSSGVTANLGDVATFKNSMVDAAEKRRKERMAALTGKPVVTAKPEPKPEAKQEEPAEPKIEEPAEPPVEEPADDKVPF